MSEYAWMLVYSSIARLLRLPAFTSFHSIHMQKSPKNFCSCKVICKKCETFSLQIIRNIWYGISCMMILWMCMIAKACHEHLLKDTKVVLYSNSHSFQKRWYNNNSRSPASWIASVTHKHEWIYM